MVKTWTKCVKKIRVGFVVEKVVALCIWLKILFPLPVVVSWRLRTFVRRPPLKPARYHIYADNLELRVRQ